MTKKITDKDRIDFLQRLNDQSNYTGKCIMRMSSANRGWRLHETSRREAHRLVRDTIDEMIETQGYKGQDDNE